VRTPFCARRKFRRTIHGITRNFLLLFRTQFGVVTVTNPVFAPVGTIAPKKVSSMTLQSPGFR